MSEVEFTYKGTSTIIQCNQDDTFKAILEKLFAKIEINPDTIYYLYSGKVLEKKEGQTFSSMANKLDKERNKMNIQILDSEKPEEKGPDSLIKSKDIICPECKENCFISVNNFKIRLYGCTNEHDIDGIALEDFEKTQKIDESKILCDECKVVNKMNAYKKIFYRCNICKKNLCPLCKNKHETTHNIIDYEDKNYICPLHNYPYSLYCKTCQKNLCISCEMEHNEILNSKDNEFYM